MKIRIEFDVPDEVVKKCGYEKVKPKQLREELKKALVQGLSRTVSDYPGGHEVEGLYEMVKED
jgi:hypothetical protein